MSSLKPTSTAIATGSAGMSGLTWARARLGVLLVGHAGVDVYSAFVPPIILLLTNRASLTPSQAAWILGTGSLASGLSQPVAAWLSDRTDSRVLAAIGLMVAAVCLSGIGLARDFTTLLAIYAVGQAGVGVFHPIAVASIGHIAHRALAGRRALGVSLFFVAGMAGGAYGSSLSPRITAEAGGFTTLGWLMIPGIVIAVALAWAISQVPHRHETHRELRFDPHVIRARWSLILALWFMNAMRFIVNMALVYLLVAYARELVSRRELDLSPEQIVATAAPIGGDFLALMTIGMAIGGLTAGIVVRPGREKLPLCIIPIVFAPAILAVPYCGESGVSLLAVALGVGFAALVPVTIGLAQRLLPHRTSLASALMLGGAWATAVVGPAAAEHMLHQWNMSFKETFACTAALLAASGLLAIPIRRAVFREAADEHGTAV